MTIEKNQNQNQNDHIMLPISFFDIDNIAEILTDRNTQIIVVMSNYEDTESMQSIMSYLTFQRSTSYACIRCKKINKKSFYVYSEHV